MNKPILILLFLAVLAAAIGGYYFWVKKGPSVDNGAFMTGRKDISASAVPERFPTNIKIPVEGKVVDSFNYGVGGDKLQATRIVESSKSVEENYQYYKDIISSRYGWAVLSVSTSSPNSKSIFAQNTEGRINVNITKTGTGSRVDISFTVQK